MTVTGLPFRIPTAKDIALYVRALAQTDPNLTVGTTKDAKFCVVGRYIDQHPLHVEVMPYEVHSRTYNRYVYHGLPKIVAYYQRDRAGRIIKNPNWSERDRGANEFLTIYMQPDLARLARLFDTVAERGEIVRAGDFHALIQREMPFLYREDY